MKQTAMESSTVGAKGQVVIPKKIRAMFHPPYQERDASALRGETRRDCADPSTRATAFPRLRSGQAGRGLAQDSAPHAEVLRAYGRLPWNRRESHEDTP